MKIIIAGAGNVGTHLAKLLSREKQDIILMDDDEEKLSALSANFDLLTVAASPSSISGLKEVGVKEADLFIATYWHYKGQLIIRNPLYLDTF